MRLKKESRTHFPARRASLFVLVILVTLLLGCTPVKPWEKGHLSKPHMLINPDPLDARFNRHIEESREGSSGGYGVGGGGCGCG